MASKNISISETTIAAHWEQVYENKFGDMEYPEQIPKEFIEASKNNLKTIFYAGALAAFKIVEQLSYSDFSEEAVDAIYESLDEEIEEQMNSCSRPKCLANRGSHGRNRH